MPPQPLTHLPIYFGPFLVTPQVFHLTPLSYALVNLKPLLPGHVLVCPRRVVPRFASLTPAEVSDLFATVQRVSRMIERVYGAHALNIAIQDGKAAGQSVEHVHCHVIPRKERDMDERGGGDKLYDMMEGEEGDIGKELRRNQEVEQRHRFAGPDVERRPRSEEEMRKEAELLAQEMEKEVD
ncbi:HIT-like domain-containing protein [Macrophomina phaseolina]|uniref:Bis(5'-adenosyl)-triphosphatase n=1 Tax=Macrophomina phaseolina TaxID=35725 RepID=A0ABQ8GER8_9PEZI|nr:HIT-like domain-containing protein [Macrophomina phaseolina]